LDEQVTDLLGLDKKARALVRRKKKKKKKHLSLSGQN